MEELTLDLGVQEVQVHLRDPKTGEIQDYVLRAANGYAVTEYQNAKMAGMVVAGDGSTATIHDRMANVGPLLLSRCLWRPMTQPDGTTKEVPVSIKTIQGFPGRVQEALFERAKEISEIDQPDTAEALQKQIASLQQRLEKLQAEKEPAKNEPNGMTDGFD